MSTPVVPSLTEALLADQLISDSQEQTASAGFVVIVCAFFIALMGFSIACIWRQRKKRKQQDTNGINSTPTRQELSDDIGQTNPGYDGDIENAAAINEHHRESVTVTMRTKHDIDNSVGKNKRHCRIYDGSRNSDNISCKPGPVCGEIMQNFDNHASPISLKSTEDRSSETDEHFYEIMESEETGVHMRNKLTAGSNCLNASSDPTHDPTNDNGHYPQADNSNRRRDQLVSNKFENNDINPQFSPISNKQKAPCGNISNYVTADELFHDKDGSELSMTYQKPKLTEISSQTEVGVEMRSRSGPLTTSKADIDVMSQARKVPHDSGIDSTHLNSLDSSSEPIHVTADKLFDDKDESESSMTYQIPKSSEISSQTEVGVEMRSRSGPLTISKPEIDVKSQARKVPHDSGIDSTHLNSLDSSSEPIHVKADKLFDDKDESESSMTYQIPKSSKISSQTEVYVEMRSRSGPLTISKPEIDVKSQARKVPHDSGIDSTHLNSLDTSYEPIHVKADKMFDDKDESESSMTYQIPKSSKISSQTEVGVEMRSRSGPLTISKPEIDVMSQARKVPYDSGIDSTHLNNLDTSYEPIHVTADKLFDDKDESESSMTYQIPKSSKISSQTEVGVEMRSRSGPLTISKPEIDVKSQARKVPHDSGIDSTHLNSLDSSSEPIHVKADKLFDNKDESESSMTYQIPKSSEISSETEVGFEMRSRSCPLTISKPEIDVISQARKVPHDSGIDSTHLNKLDYSSEAIYENLRIFRVPQDSGIDSTHSNNLDSLSEPIYDNYVFFEEAKQLQS